MRSDRAPLERRIKELEGEVGRLARAHGPDATCRPFNLQAPADVSELLFVHLQLPPPPAAVAFKSGSRCSNVGALGHPGAPSSPAALAGTYAGSGRDLLVPAFTSFGRSGRLVTSWRWRSLHLSKHYVTWLGVRPDCFSTYAIY